MPNGIGTFYYSNGEIYDGEWKDGKAYGWGVYKCPSGEIYEG